MNARIFAAEAPSSWSQKPSRVWAWRAYWIAMEQEIIADTAAGSSSHWRIPHASKTRRSPDMPKHSSVRIEP